MEKDKESRSSAPQRQRMYHNRLRILMQAVFKMITIAMQARYDVLREASLAQSLTIQTLAIEK